jgi:hypothetical protein
MVGFINVQIHGKAMTISQAKQSLQLLIHGGPKHRWFQYTAQQPTAPCETPGHGFRLSARPKGKGRQGHQLKLHPTLPTPLEKLKRLPTRCSARATTINMATDGPQTLRERLLQSPFSAGQHHLSRARLMLREIGLQRPVIGAEKIGMVLPSEGFIEMHMGIHKPWQHHMRWWRFTRIQRA